VPSSVMVSRVNDGICGTSSSQCAQRIVLISVDPECCDGSDEWMTGACPNDCAEIGREHRARVDAELKTRKTVSSSTLGSGSADI
jgi:protein kinase C substrate 80K-H